MKKSLILLLIFVLALGSCTTDDTDREFIHGKWNLTKIINTSLGGTSAPDVNDTHYYQINTNGSFKRVSIKDGISEVLIGSYVASDESPVYGNETGSIQKFIELSYSSEVQFSNCGLINEDKQVLILTSDKLLQNTLSGACDGENYEYTKE